MKDVENVTGHMGEGEAVSPEEEVGNVAAASGAEPIETTAEDMANTSMEAQKSDDVASAQASADPWGALLQFGSQLVTALTATDNGGTTPHPWIERDPTTGRRNLKVPLPPPETARRFADALTVLADALRGR